MKVSIKNRLSRSSTEADLANQLKRIKDVLEHGIDEDNFLLTSSISINNIANPWALCPLAICNETIVILGAANILARLAAPVAVGYFARVHAISAWTLTANPGGDVQGVFRTGGATATVTTSAADDEHYVYENLQSSDDTAMTTPISFAAAKRALDIEILAPGAEDFTAVVAIAWAKFVLRNEDPTV